MHHMLECDTVRSALATVTALLPTCPVASGMGLDALIQVGDQLHIRAAERLMCLGAADDFEKFVVHFSGLFFERLLRCDVDVLQRYVFVCRNFAARFVLG